MKLRVGVTAALRLTPLHTPEKEWRERGGVGGGVGGTEVELEGER